MAKLESDPRDYYVYFSRKERVTLSEVDKIFLDVGGNATIFAGGICIAAFPSRAYSYIIAVDDDTMIETVNETAIVTKSK